HRVASADWVETQQWHSFPPGCHLAWEADIAPAPCLSPTCRPDNNPLSRGHTSSAGQVVDQRAESTDPSCRCPAGWHDTFPDAFANTLSETAPRCAPKITATSGRSSIKTGPSQRSKIFSVPWTRQNPCQPWRFEACALPGACSFHRGNPPNLPAVATSVDRVPAPNRQEPRLLLRIPREPEAATRIGAP